MRRIKQAFVSWVSYIILIAIMRFIGRISAKKAARLGAFIGRLLYLYNPARRRLAKKNLGLALKGKPEQELDAILAACYDNIGKCFIEFLRLQSLNKNRTLDQTISIEGEEHLQAALAKGRGVILLTAHYGNWELVGARLAAAGYSLNVLARHQSSKGLTHLFNEIREASGMRVLQARTGDATQVLSCLRRNEIVGFLVDQNAGRAGIFVDFFQRSASTFSGAAFFALRTGAAVVPGFGLRNPDDTHIARLFPEVELIRTGDLRKDIEANTAAFTRLVEEQIRSRPELWLWLHDRWRTQPRRKACTAGRPETRNPEPGT